MKLPLDIAKVRKVLRALEVHFNAYKALLLFLMLASLYGFIAVRIAVLSNAAPNQADLSKAQKAERPKRIPSETAAKLKSLEGSNDRTQAIFSEARQNPFKE